MTRNDKICARFDGGASDLVFWSFRYFLGRMTIAACAFAEDLARVWPLLAPNIQNLIMQELENAFDRDDKLRLEAKEQGKPATYLPLGHDCDREAWEKVRTAYSSLNKANEK